MQAAIAPEPAKPARRAGTPGAANGGKEACDHRHEEEHGVEQGVPNVHPEERAAERHREQRRHRDEVVPIAVAPFEVLRSEEAERTDTEAVEERGHVQEEDRLAQWSRLEDPMGREADREGEEEDDD